MQSVFFVCKLLLHLFKEERQDRLHTAYINKQSLLFIQIDYIPPCGTSISVMMLRLYVCIHISHLVSIVVACIELDALRGSVRSYGV